jgi:hypothetical protein
MNSKETTEFSRIHQTQDPIEAQMICELLSNNEIPARSIGTQNAAMIGAAQIIMKIFIEVPTSDQEQATELIESFFDNQNYDDPEMLKVLEEEALAATPPPPPNWSLSMKQMSILMAVIFGFVLLLAILNS